MLSVFVKILIVIQKIVVALLIGREFNQNKLFASFDRLHNNAMNEDIFFEWTYL